MPRALESMRSAGGRPSSKDTEPPVIHRGIRGCTPVRDGIHLTASGSSTAGHSPVSALKANLAPRTRGRTLTPRGHSAGPRRVGRRRHTRRSQMVTSMSRQKPDKQPDDRQQSDRHNHLRRRVSPSTPSRRQRESSRVAHSHTSLQAIGAVLYDCEWASPLQRWIQDRGCARPLASHLERYDPRHPMPMVVRSGSRGRVPVATVGARGGWAAGGWCEA